MFKFKRLALSVIIGGALAFTSVAKSYTGPEIDFGDNGFLRTDIKLL